MPMGSRQGRLKLCLGSRGGFGARQERRRVATGERESGEGEGERERAEESRRGQEEVATVKGTTE